MSQLIKIDDLKDKMKLSMPVKNKFGQVLLTQGTEIEEKHKKMLRMWGIQEVYIKADSEGETSAYDERMIDEVKEVLKKRFYWEPRNAIEKDLYEMALQIKLEKM